MNNTIITKDIYYAMAEQIIMAKDEQSTTAKVLAAIMKYSEKTDSMITIEMGNHVRTELALSGPNYRKSIARLYRLGILKKLGASTIINFKYYSPVTSVTLK